MERRFDLADRLMDWAVLVSQMARGLPRDPVGWHVARQLVRSCTAPAANYAEALGAESRRDFVHKMKLALKELCESHMWLRYLQRMQLVRRDEAEPCLREAWELISIFAASVKTAHRNLSQLKQRS